jgi:short-subunit dehydrogenase
MTSESHPPRLLVLGATSAIAHALARRWAARGAAIVLLARDRQALEANAADLRVRGAAAVHAVPFDALDTDGHAAALDAAWAAVAGQGGGAHSHSPAASGFDAALLAWGTLPDQAACEADVATALAAFDANARSVLALLTLLAPRFEAQRRGAIAVISSVAGERGRASNYVYGAAKAAVTALTSGLRHRLTRHGVRVVTVLPGFVDTPMTAAFAKGPLWASPERVAADIDRALARGNGTLYTPWFWWGVMALVKALPERVFVKTKL